MPFLWAFPTVHLRLGSLTISSRGRDARDDIMIAALAHLRERLGADVLLEPDEADLGRHRHDFNNVAPDSLELYGVAYPRSTAEVAAILRACNVAGVPVTPQGGLTGMAGGAVPNRPSLILSLERMRAIEEIDTAAATMTVQAGAILEKVQDAAEAANMFFALDLGGRSSAQIGGNASTNAGGNRVLRYGTMRDLILGVEAVLADGTIVSSLNKMLKNNAGYDLKQLFIGSEGTLGVITRLVLRLHQKPSSVCTSLVAVADYDKVLGLLRYCRSHLGSTLVAFEAMWPDFYRLGTTGLGHRLPISEGHGIYVLIETLGADQDSDQARFESVVAEALEQGVIDDAVIAHSGQARRELWAIRECPGEFRKIHWPQVGFDVSLPIGDIGAFVSQCLGQLRARWPQISAVPFGHIADSNLHFSVRLDPDISERELEQIVYRAVSECKGSISAEHGIGSLKREFLHYSRTPQELALMKTLKDALDPKGILNPGKVIQ
jgi:FAD/FMN-containing dehydrogenase